jgi:hypothetical protein
LRGGNLRLFVLTVSYSPGRAEVRAASAAAIASGIYSFAKAQAAASVGWYYRGGAVGGPARRRPLGTRSTVFHGFVVLPNLREREELQEVRREGGAGSLDGGLPLRLIFGMSARLLLFGRIPTLVECGGDAGRIARRARALCLIELMKECPGITVSLAADGSFVAFFQPNVGIAGLTGFWPARPESVEALQRDGVVLAHRDLMNQIPAYATPDDATTGALPANLAGSWRRNQLRLEANTGLPNRRDQI